MRELRLGLEHQIDVTPYAKSLYRADQMREIRKGIENNVDINLYKSMVHPAQEMRIMRKWLEDGKTLPSNLSKLFSGQLEEELQKPADEEVKALQFLQTCIIVGKHLCQLDFDRHVVVVGHDLYT